MSSLSVSGDIAAAGVFWVSHLLMSYAIRKYRQVCIMKDMIEVPSELPFNGTLLIKTEDGKLVTVPEGLPVINVNYGDGPSVHEMKGGGIIMGLDDDGIKKIVYSGVSCDCYANNSAPETTSHESHTERDHISISYDSSDEQYYQACRSVSF